ncbi:hypothetical protein A3Q56_05340, partial [Intoshia linei]
NGIAIYAIKSNKNFHQKPMYLFFINLAISDLIVANEWRFGFIFCQIWGSVDMAVCTASIYFLCTISFKRYQLVNGASKNTNLHQNSMKVVISIWICSLIVSSIPFIDCYVISKYITHNIASLEYNIENNKCEVFMSRFTIITTALLTDHLPLIFLLKNVTKGHAAARIKRWAVFLREYIYKLEHVKGKHNEIADCLSRLPGNMETERIDIKYVHMISNPPYLSMNEINEATETDELLKKIIKYILTRWPSKEQLSLKEMKFYHIRNKLWT